MKPVIGVSPLWDEKKNSIWMIPGYMDGIVQAGGLPVILPLTDDESILEQAMKLCNGFLLTGGQDVSPALYGETAKYDDILPCRVRDKMDEFILNRAIEQDKPVLGICRGIQLINAVLGGTLYQDIPTETASPLEHHQTPPYELPVHEVDILPESPLFHLLQTEKLAVNSYHHQGIKKLSPRLRCMAKATDGLTEAVYMPGQTFLWAVQWHPELSYFCDAYSAKIFKSFISHATLSPRRM